MMENGAQIRENQQTEQMDKSPALRNSAEMLQRVFLSTGFVYSKSFKIIWNKYSKEQF